MMNSPVDLKARARAVMVERGFHPDFPAEAAGEIAALQKNPPQAAQLEGRDMRELAWSSIDNETSRDLDQVEYAETLADGTVRLLIGIADVDTFVQKGSALDRHAAAETTSVYTGVATFPMLPPELSTDVTSLVDQAERLAIVIELRVKDSGEI